MKTFLLTVLPVLFAANSHAWDYEGHRLVNKLALASLPGDFPAFVLTPAARERIAFLAGEADRWRNSSDPTFRHFNAPDHYLDIEKLADYGLTATTLPVFRYDFTAQLALGRAARPDKFETIDPKRDPDHTRTMPGFLPWTITESVGKLKSGFAYLKALQEAGTSEEIANAQQNIIYVMGVMGHYVGDATQPLHTTKHYNGWEGPNPHGYTTNKTFHSFIDGGYLNKLALKSEQLVSKMRPAKPLEFASNDGNPTNIFPVVMKWLSEQHKLVVPLYELEKARKFNTRAEADPEAVEFIVGQLLQGGQMLGDLWVTAWKQAPADTFLRSQLMKRKSTRSEE